MTRDELIEMQAKTDALERVNMRTRIALLEAALEPFALLAQEHLPPEYRYPMVEVGLPGHPVVYADDLRRAAEAMPRGLRKTTPST